MTDEFFDDKSLREVKRLYDPPAEPLDVLEALAQEVALLQGGELVELWLEYCPDDGLLPDIASRSLGLFICHTSRHGRRFTRATPEQAACSTPLREVVSGSHWERPFVHWSPPPDSLSEIEAIKRRFKELLDEFT